MDAWPNQKRFNITTQTRVNHYCNVIPLLHFALNLFDYACLTQVNVIYVYKIVIYFIYYNMYIYIYIAFSQIFLQAAP